MEKGGDGKQIFFLGEKVSSGSVLCIHPYGSKGSLGFLRSYPSNGYRHRLDSNDETTDVSTSASHRNIHQPMLITR